MNVATNLLVVLFLVFMAYWWAKQGLFNSFMHLVAVIVAGAIAFGLWEPIALMMTGKAFGRFAWGVGLFVPFIVALLLWRVLYDRLIGEPVDFNYWTDTLGGGVLGLFSGILTAGVVILGVSFTHVGGTTAGLQRLAMNEAGEVVDAAGGGLWFAVDSMTAGFYSRLSTGAFAPQQGMGVYRPNLVKQASLFQLHPDSWASRVLTPGSVTVDAFHVIETPVEGFHPTFLTGLASEQPDLASQLSTPGHRLVVVGTTWNDSPPGTYDSDQTLRVPPAQVRLGAMPRNGRRPDLVAPFGAGAGSANAGGVSFTPFNSPGAMLVGTDTSMRFAFAFLIPEGAEPWYIMLRNERFSLVDGDDRDDPLLASTAMTGMNAQSTGESPTDAGDDSSTSADAGSTPTQQNGAEPGYREGGMTGTVADFIAVTNTLPRIFSRNQRGGLEVPTGERYVTRGTATIPPASTGRISGENAVGQVFEPSHKRTVRVELSADRARTFLGGARVAVGRLQSLWLEDDSGNKWEPIGYAMRQADGAVIISFDPDNPIRSGANLPQVSSGEVLYLYFWANPGTRIVSYNFGSTQQRIDPPLEVPAR